MATGNTAPAFDLSQYESRDTAVLTVQNPKGDDLIGVNGETVKITLYGPGSKQYVNAKYKFDNAMQTRSVALLRGKASKNAAEENAQLLAERLAACTAQIENFPIEGGALALYSNPKLGYITDQVTKFLDDHENFMPGAPTN
jgi:hypothetical protein